MLYFVYTLFILFILSHHHFELSAQSDVKHNRFGTLLPDVLKIRPYLEPCSSKWCQEPKDLEPVCPTWCKHLSRWNGVLACMRARVIQHMYSRAGDNTFFNIEYAKKGDACRDLSHIYIYIYISSIHFMSNQGHRFARPWLDIKCEQPFLAPFRR